MTSLAIILQIRLLEELDTYADKFVNVECGSKAPLASGASMHFHNVIWHCFREGYLRPDRNCPFWGEWLSRQEKGQPLTPIIPRSLEKHFDTPSSITYLMILPRGALRLQQLKREYPDE